MDKSKKTVQLDPEELARIKNDRADYMTAVGFARLYLGEDPPNVEAALKAMDHYCDRVDKRLHDALVELGIDPALFNV